MTPRYALHAGATAEQVLYVLNGQQTVNLGHLTFYVVTGTYTPHRLETQSWPFTPGEIVVVDHSCQDGVREFLGGRRDLAADWEDWDWVVHQANLEECLAIADKVRSDAPRGYYAWTADGLCYALDQGAAHHVWCGHDSVYVRIGDHVGRGHMAEWREKQAAG